MVLEFLFGSKEVRKHPIFLLFQSILLSSLAIWIGYVVFPNNSSIAAIAFVTIGLVPLIEKILSDEEEDEEQRPGNSLGFLARHSEIIAIYGWFFLGLIISYSFWFYALPATESPLCIAGLCIQAPVKDKVFAEQENALGIIRGSYDSSAKSARENCFGTLRSIGTCTEAIFENNAIVLGLAILFSFLYGAGAIFLLAWNASVIGILLGQQALSLQAYQSGIASGIGLIPHGVLEIGAYFFGAIAGGIISAAIIRGKFQTKAFTQVAKDSLVLIIAAYILLAAGAIVEAAIIFGNIEIVAAVYLFLGTGVICWLYFFFKERKK
ncbi:MAG: stage II sporulation protein M [Candidatus Diapherotrites archaeon]|nr:stage II sporulation protein M [Candidatus Diapherotrites archaeon]